MSTTSGYTGDVRPGGPPDVRVLDRAVVAKRSVGPTDNAAYVVACRATGLRMLVDAAADASLLLELVEQVGEACPTGPLAVVVTTHRHRDHLGALADVVDATGARTAAGADDAEAIEGATGVEVTDPLLDGDVLALGELRLDVVHLRGHTPGSVALALVGAEDSGRSHLFTGDSLFPGGVGNTQGDPARFASLIGDVTARLFEQYGDDTWVYPGHGRDTTLGAERPHLAEWRARGW
ncbi:MBL fold metallo-hydrolase [Isoptericola variabilis]|uniref:Zn-dependent hydrolase, glyoxylase n=1 Tax=Isoptericola variabilis (strain 225) TaxID=743718 RepID=F6FUB3_ISOV2|nr:MBL fold metallo-hydrolase [Isoptericola variabilis]AEG44241.1 Zn-dependent hydrolase, glyoxylase [Isoptericola variabilis 225]TWH28439.1 glyoxylase-like metal-dependent hydrolase (beta-lactamase superfamily II) [Isoptericola variabilis J7]